MAGAASVMHLPTVHSHIFISSSDNLLHSTFAWFPNKPGSVESGEYEPMTGLMCLTSFLHQIPSVKSPETNSMHSVSSFQIGP